jgi:Gluconate 2-dehydrogenase subunit 3
MTPHANRGNARRSALLRLGALCGLALAGDIPAALASSKRAVPALLSADELALTGVLAELVIPRTETPGALDVGAHHTIDHLLKTCATAADQTAFRASLARIDTVAREHAGKPFRALPPVRQAALLRALDDGSAPFTPADMAAFRKLKSYVAFAYYTSEAGAVRELAYLPVPGGFTGYVRVTPKTRTWAI